MDALTALHTRTSSNLLCEPAPTKAQLENIFKAGMRACDHRLLEPWEFILIEGEGRDELGALFAQVKEKELGALPDSEIKRIKSKALRAPTIVVVVAKCTENPKVPIIEQEYSAAASAQMMMTAAFAQGVGAIWRSGSIMFDPELAKGLDLAPDDKIVGFLYLGTPRVVKPTPTLEANKFVRRWPAPN